jgi:hypothetical protein
MFNYGVIKVSKCKGMGNRARGLLKRVDRGGLEAEVHDSLCVGIFLS